MMRLLNIYISEILIVAALSASVFAGDTIESLILRIWQDRIYFTAGTDQLVYPGSEFVIYRADDSLAGGKIESSLLGISFGTTAGINRLEIDSCYAKIRTASIDTINPIRIGLMPAIARLGIVETSDSLQSKFNQVELIKYDDPAELEFDLKRGSIDAALSYNPIYSQNTVTSHPIAAPFVAAMLPNTSKEINDNGHLTTSLFYRCDDDRMELLFDGNNILPFTHLGLGNDSTPRFYPFDPVKGRQLARQMKKRNDLVTIYAEADEFQTMSSYFAGLLAIDGIRTTNISDKAEADLQLLFIPLDSDDSLVVIDNMTSALNQNRSATKKITETIGLIKSNIEDARKAENHRLFRYYANHARHRLIEEIGAYTVFRPSYFICSAPSIRNIKTDSSGRIDLRLVEKLILPSSTEIGHDF